ncbi:hypothetical protein GGS24DRAFT_446206 [Hypoxylon argillaceum]|nr:hypothetical protein GGS24DRAFT_446206 [Hypoxylon argillaceum]KAI1153167.1 hypothetical protein F4825DRAFT_416193 [Nemania diffusa]
MDCASEQPESSTTSSTLSALASSLGSTATATTTSTPTSTPSPFPYPSMKVPKLRSSCDACGSAKVKCDRRQPHCSRCLSLGSVCVYGVSRKYGKPPRKTIGAAKDRPLPSVDRQDALSVLPTPPGITEMPRARNDFLFFPDVDDFAMTDAPYHEGFDSGLFPPLSLDQWLQSDTLAFGFGTPPASNSDHDSVDRGSSQGASDDSAASHTSHNCHRESYEILLRLGLGHGDFSRLAVASPSDLDTGSAQLDRVLHLNRNAIDRLTKLLSCSCRRSPHLAMLYASIISRILVWYQQAVGCKKSWCPNTTPADTMAAPATNVTAASASPADDIPTLSRTTGFVVEPMQLTMGAFKIDDQAVQATLRSHLVLSELKKASTLIDHFTSQGLGGSNTASSVDSLYTSLGGWLRSELSTTVKEIKSRMRMLEDTASF